MTSKLERRLEKKRVRTSVSSISAFLRFNLSKLSKEKKIYVLKF